MEEKMMYYLQSAFENPLKNEFDQNDIWNKRLINSPVFNQHYPYCHQFEKTLSGKFIYKKTLKNI